MERAKVETGAAALSLVLSGLGLAEAWAYTGDGGMMPRAVMAMMVVLTSVWCAGSVMRIGRDPGGIITATPRQIRGAMLLIVAGAGLLLGMQYLGFFTTAVIVLPAVAFGLGYRNAQGLAIATVLFMCLLIAVFRVLLAVPLPEEMLFSLIRG